MFDDPLETMRNQESTPTFIGKPILTQTIVKVWSSYRYKLKIMRLFDDCIIFEEQIPESVYD